MMNAFRALKVDRDGSDSILTLEGWPTTSHLVFTETSQGSGRWTAGGPATQYIEQRTQVQINGIGVSTWCLVEPGGFEHHFKYVATGNYDAELLLEKDSYGNYKTYGYHPGTAQNIRAIAFNGDTGYPAAGGQPANPGRPASTLLLFDVIGLDTDTSITSSDRRYGLLRRVRLLRTDPSTEMFVTTHEVEYTYAGDDASTGCGVSTTDSSCDDLVQVAYKTRVNPESSPAQWRYRVHQYRYHDGTAHTGFSDERLNTSGRLHQLKMSIAPEQVEYFAQTVLASTSGPTGDEVLTQAASLRALDDDDVAFSEGGRDYLVVDLAEKVVSYALSGTFDTRVIRQYVQAGCGCAGPTQGIAEDYNYLRLGDPSPTTVITEYLVNGSTGLYTEPYRTRFHDMALRGAGSSIPYLRYMATRDYTSGGVSQPWVHGYEYDTSGNLVREAMPSAFQSYTAATSVQAASAAEFSSSAGIGRVLGYVYDANNRRTETRECLAGQQIGDGALIEQTEYGTDSTDVAVLAVERPYLPKIVRRVRTMSTTIPSSDDDVESTTFQYRFFSTGDLSGTSAVPSDALSCLVVTKERELLGENGPDTPGSAVSTYECFNQQGENTWSIDAKGMLTYREFDQITGALETTTVNADPAGTATGQPAFQMGEFIGLNQILASAPVGQVGNGGSLTTRTATDLLGRVVSVSVSGGESSGGPNPDGIVGYTVRGMLELPDRPGILYYCETTLPPSDGTTYSGPAVRTWYSASGNAIATSQYTIASSNYSTQPPTFAFESTSQDHGEVGRSRIDNTPLGLVTASTVWSDVPFGSSTGTSHTTTFGHDALGRVRDTVTPNGTVVRHEYDVMDRVVEELIGIVSGSNFVTTRQWFYDWNGSGSPSQGTGDGTLVLLREHTGETANPTRDTRNYYDSRNRLVATLKPSAPHSRFEYDNLDRLVVSELYSVDPSGSSPPSASQRLLRKETSYSQRGLPYRERQAIDPTASSLTYLETHRWYDERGLSLAEWNPSSAGIKRAYDALGRVVKQVVTDRDGDAAPGTTDSFADATSWDDDHIAEQHETRYATHEEAWTGAALVETTRMRPHDATCTGDLASCSNTVVTYKATYYDYANRPIRGVDLGTNIGDGTGIADGILQSGGSAPTWPPSTIPEPTASPSIQLVSAIEYDAKGRVAATIDPSGQRTESRFDDLDRPILAIENADDQSPVTFDWYSTDNRWRVLSGLSTSTPDVNRTTSTVYDTSGNVIKSVAHLSSSGGTDQVQVTEYVYGTTLGSAGTPTDSLIESNDILRETRFPDESTGLPQTSDNTLKVRYSYNRLGEQRSLIDQNGTTHVYARDILGRVTSDTATIATNSPIDDHIRRIGTSYDSAGRVTDVVSYMDTSGTTAANAVRFTYTPLWQIENVFQDHDGVVQESAGVPLGNTQRVKYGYFTSPATAYNTTRPFTIHYPSTPSTSSGSVMYFHDDFERIYNVNDPDAGEIVAEYQFLGFATPAIVDLGWHYFQLDRTVHHPGEDPGTRRFWSYQTAPAGAYPGFDRFGRVISQSWVDGSFDVDGASSSEIPNQPPLFHETYAYDSASNRTQRFDARPGTHKMQFKHDEQFVHDGLHRLTEAQRKHLSSKFTPGHGTSSTTNVLGSQRWTLDAVGNWAQQESDLANPIGTYDLSDDHTHNRANEITQRVIPIGGTPTTLPFAYDDSGNLMHARHSADSNYDRVIHDAWNRIVKYDVTSDPGNPNLISLQYTTFEYNGLNWRTKTFEQLGYGTQTRLMYYSSQWQLIEEHISDYEDAADVTHNRVVQERFGTRSLDDVSLRTVRIPTGTSSEGTPPDQWDTYTFDDYPYFHLTDVQFSTRAMVRAAMGGEVFERVDYDAYGRAHHSYAADVDQDGDVDNDDYTILKASASAAPVLGDQDYDVRQDLDRDGVLDYDDADIVALYTDRVSPSDGHITDSDPSWKLMAGPGPDNTFGYAGYVFHPASRLYLARNRWYNTETGRWLERDPAGYVDGMNLYQYCSGMAISCADPMGLDWDWVPTDDDFVNGRTWIYQITPSWDEFVNGNTVAYRAFEFAAEHGVVDTATHLANGAYHQFYVNPVSAAHIARINARSLGYDYWSTAYMGVGVGVQTFLGGRGVYEGMTGEDVLTGDSISMFDRSGRIFSGAMQATAVAGTPAAGQSVVSLLGRSRLYAAAATIAPAARTSSAIEESAASANAIVRRPGRFMENPEAPCLPHERKYGNELASRGYDVHGHGHGTPGPDFTVNGRSIEYARVTGTGHRTIYNQIINKLKKNQAAEIHIDTRGLSPTRAYMAANRAVTKGMIPQGTSVRIITDRGEYTFRRH
ncbi:MAG: RHS repeat-associated core domain-containing protein [Phycisphaerales bacterium]